MATRNPGRRPRGRTGRRAQTQRREPAGRPLPYTRRNCTFLGAGVRDDTDWVHLPVPTPGRRFPVTHACAHSAGYRILRTDPTRPPAGRIEKTARRGFRQVRGRLAQPVRAPALQAGGHWFESSIAHHSSSPSVRFPFPDDRGDFIRSPYPPCFSFLLTVIV